MNEEKVTPKAGETKPVQEPIKPATPEVKPPEPKPESLYSLLKAGKLAIGTRVSFRPKGAKAKKSFKVDEAFLKTTLMEPDYYDEYEYKIE